MDIVVVGAGLAGLAAAKHAMQQGHPTVVLEASDAVGGRVRTDHVDGFRLDRGFQLFNPAYPEAERVLDLASLDLRPFVAGAQIILASRGRRRVARVADPRREPSWLASTLTAPLGSPWSTVRFGTYALSRTLRDEPDVTAYEALRRAGADRTLIERLLRPFLSGVFLEAELTTSRHFLDLVLRSFVRGTPSLPGAGMQAIPEQLAVGLDVRLNSPVRAVQPHLVTLADGQTITADAVIVATDPQTAGRFLPQVRVPAARSVTTWYYRSDTPPEELAGGRPVLIIDGARRGPLLNTVVPSHAAPAYAPPGVALVSASALGVRDTVAQERAVRDHLGWLYGAHAERWELIARYAIPYALPAMPVPLDVRRPVALGDGLYVAGDHRDTSSIQGALVSGRRAAQAALAEGSVT
ncbi:MAG: NAD(P)/FAD-dependent oxidoreductase [Candidatus Nanopelagicales bacterium]